MPNRGVHLPVGTVSRAAYATYPPLGISRDLIYGPRQPEDWLEGLEEGCFPTGLTRPAHRAIAPKRTA